MSYIVISAIALAVIGYSCAFVIQQQNIGIIERFGKFNRVAYPGLGFMIPFVERKTGSMSLRIQQLNLLVETKTHDNVFVKVKVAVQFKVIEDRIYEAYYKLYAPAEQIEAFVFDVVRAKVPNIYLDDLFAKKDEIATDVMNELDETMESFGFKIVKALVTDIDPNENVKNAMNEINTAQRLRVAANERAEADKIIRIKQAEAEAEANILHGKGLSGQRKAIIEGLGESVGCIQKKSPSLDSNEIMSTILAIQYFDMLREVGASSRTNTLFVSHAPGQASSIQNQFMEALFATKERENQRDDFEYEVSDDEEALNK